MATAISNPITRDYVNAKAQAARSAAANAAGAAQLAAAQKAKDNAAASAARNAAATAAAKALYPSTVKTSQQPTSTTKTTPAKTTTTPAKTTTTPTKPQTTTTPQAGTAAPASSGSNTWLQNLAAGKDQYGNPASAGNIAFAKAELAKQINQPVGMATTPAAPAAAKPAAAPAVAPTSTTSKYAPPTNATQTTFNRGGQSMTGYIVNGSTVDAEGNKLQAGDIVSAAGGKNYLMTEAGRGVDTSSAAYDIYGKSAIGDYEIPDATTNLGRVFEFEGGYYDSATGKKISDGYLNKGDGTYQNLATGQTITDRGIQDMQNLQTILENKQAAIAQLTAAEEEMLKNQNTQNQQDLTNAAEQTTIDAAQLMDNLALRQAAQGDMGGIGQKQYSEVANAKDQRLLEINLEKKNLETQTNQQIAQLRAEGKMAEADLAESIALKQMSALNSEYDRIAAAKADEEKTMATLLGTYKGQPTMQAKEANMSQALTRLQLGIFSADDAITLGIPAADAKAYADRINLMAQIDLDTAKKQLAQIGKTSSSAGSKYDYYDQLRIYEAFDAGQIDEATRDSLLASIGAKAPTTPTTLGGGGVNDDAAIQSLAAKFEQGGYGPTTSLAALNAFNNALAAYGMQYTYTGGIGPIKK